MFTADDKNGFSYFLKYDQLTGVVACPGIELPSLQNSCYVPIEEIFGTELEDDDDEISKEQSGPVLTKKLTPPKQNN